jgi:hypothetical protein
MGLFSLSDMVISITLLLNAAALMSSKTYSNNNTNNHGEVPLSHNTVGSTNEGSSPSLNGRKGSSIEQISTEQDPNINVGSSEDSAAASNDSSSSKSVEYHALSRFYLFLNAVRKLSCVIVFWNILFIIFMVFVFRS